MTYSDLIKEIINISKSIPNVNYVDYGDIYSLNNIPTINYDVIFITPNQAELIDDSIVYSLNIFFITRWNDNIKNNLLDVQSKAMITLNNIINHIINSQNIDIDVNVPISFIPFYQKFKDVCTGVYAIIKITAPNPIGLCNY